MLKLLISVKRKLRCQKEPLGLPGQLVPLGLQVQRGLLARLEQQAVQGLPAGKVQ
ncbi:hypothetical protein D3C75_739630 [compost metagenome]